MIRTCFYFCFVTFTLLYIDSLIPAVGCGGVSSYSGRWRSSTWCNDVDVVEGLWLRVTRCYDG
ncbi:hypothetical protein BJ508DRAFT_97543 [Ascobolus immersus RN42]|uniref:Secreted protein n=1 Tax=Ascobolus immersus RN42 TaxID=1160509 RepID=A0A3N4IR64_ASCIM|nr:hypothetical protein BJ508DRAFT_97543 [Ascobolus immersus RN42]